MWWWWWCIRSGIVFASRLAEGIGEGVTLDVQVDGAIVHFTSPIETVRSQARIFCQTSGIEDLDCEKAIYTLAAAKISNEFPEAWIPNHDPYDVRSCRFTPDLIQLKLMEEDIAQDEEWRSTAPLEIFNIPPGKVISKTHMVSWKFLSLRFLGRGGKYANCFCKCTPKICYWPCTIGCRFGKMRSFEPFTSSFGCIGDSFDQVRKPSFFRIQL
jgi:hypothetical protein